MNTLLARLKSPPPPLGLGDDHRCGVDMRFARRIPPFIFNTLTVLSTFCLHFDTQAQTPASDLEPKTVADLPLAPQSPAAPQDSPIEVKANTESQTSTPASRQKRAQSPLEAAERYYRAEDLNGLHLALRDLQRFWPNHPLRWEVEAIHQVLIQSAEGSSFAALNALESIADFHPELAVEAWPLIPRALYSWPMLAQGEYTQRLHHLIDRFPDKGLSASMAWSARHIAHFSANQLAYTRSGEHIGQLLPLHIIGTWDNDQGKGLDVPYPPETSLDPTASYPGKLTEISWRSDYPKDLRGKVNLGELLSPELWQVAYGASVIQVKEAGEAALRISTSDPIKVWVNQELIFSAARVDGWLFDGITLPIKLHAGANSILIKSAQQTGAWMLTARITTLDGAALVYESKSLDTPVKAAVSTLKEQKPLDEHAIAQQYQARFSSEAPARRDFHTLHLLEESGLKIERLHYAEEVTSRFPKSLWLKVSRATALWENGELGQAADLIAQLYDLTKEDGAAPYLVALQTRFWSQQRLDVKARQAARTLLEQQPKLPFAYTHLAKLLSSKGWHEERCSLLYRAERLAPTHREIQSSLSQCETAVGRRDRSQIRTQDLQARYPQLTTSLDDRYAEANRKGDHASMISIAEHCIRAWPQRAKCYLNHSMALWRAERTAEALNSLSALSKLNPLSATPHKQRGEWLILLGNQEGAIKSWERATELDPDDQDLALRLSELKPKGSEPWLEDVPSDDKIKSIIATRSEVIPKEGANQVYLLDDEVTLFKPDGSSESVITQVIHAFNQEGRDDLTKMYVGRGRHTQLMAAYAISPDGVRVEASSIRKGIVRFRQLKIGSTVVVQYRTSEAPASYLVGHVTKSWWFQNLDTQVEESRWIVWAPKETKLKELAREANALEEIKPMERTESIRGELKRVMWRMTQLPPIPAEPRMPPLFTQVAGLQVTTVPSWDDVFKWERELLRDAFRVSPEVEELSAELFTEGMSAQDRFYKIQDYVTRNIRYQQDYEHTIAGVKPHTAAQVLSRQYGDCKDKAVLFITLAKTAGLKADFALVRTRDSGVVEKEIPSQQFNHAIVYVPAQEGFATGRFFDPTVDALDVQSLRSDDQGTLSLVYDPRENRHYWQEIPFQDPSFDESEDIVEMTLEESGKVSGQLRMRSRGKIGQILRTRARNPENFKQVMQYRVNQLLPGAVMLDHKAIQTDDLYIPAEAHINFEHDSWIHKEGEQLRIPSIVDWSPKSSFQLEERRFPLVLGHKRQWRWNLKIKVPSSFEMSHLPEDRTVGSECISIERKAHWDEAQHALSVTWTYFTLCEQLSPQEYLKHRPLARDMLQLLNEEIVLGPQTQIEKK